MGETRRVHHQSLVLVERLAPFFDARGSGVEVEFGGDPGFVVVEDESDVPHGFDHLETKRSDLGFAGILRCPARSVKGVLFAIADDAETAIHDAQVRVDRHSDAKVEFAVVLVAIEPVAVVDIAVARCGHCHGLGGLVDRVVV